MLKSHIRMQTREYKQQTTTTLPSVVVTNFDSRCLAQCYGFMNTNPLYFHILFFALSLSHYPFLSVFALLFSSFLLSLTLSAWSTDWTHTTANSKLTTFISFSSCFFFVYPSNFSHVSRLSHACSPSYGFLQSLRYRKDYDMRERGES